MKEFRIAVGTIVARRPVTVLTPRRTLVRGRRRVVRGARSFYTYGYMREEVAALRRECGG